ncbi:MAG: histidinol-phosphate transaminase [Gammaproteobacteria bacterium]|nr:histidinol-phosphate transaminase [Gammaproteobacteria bacterium]
MSDLTALARPEILELRPYRAAHYEAGLVRLNANETPWRPPGDDSAAGLNHYPEARPATLTRRLAEFYGVAPEQLLVTRGSSEAIDLLVRCFCRPGLDDVIICPPTFGMYEVYAQLQGAGIVQVPLDADRDFDLDIDAVEAAWTDRTKLVFVCSPNNPTGNRVATAIIRDLAQRLSGRGIIVLDEAYAEFADADPTAELLDACDNVVVLRTLSKALGLAGIRCGAALAAPAVVDLIGCILPPYCYPTPSQDAALASLAPENRAEFGRRVELLRSERGRLAGRLAELPCIDKVWPSEANFLLVRAEDPDVVTERARHAGFLLRNFSWDRYTPNCLRITIGTPEQNDALLEALANQG